MVLLVLVSGVMLMLARLVVIAVVVGLYVSVVGWYEHKGAEVCILASLQ